MPAKQIKILRHPYSDTEQLAEFLIEGASHFENLRCGKKTLRVEIIATPNNIYKVMTVIENTLARNKGRLGFTLTLGASFYSRGDRVCGFTIQPPSLCWEWECFQKEDVQTRVTVKSIVSKLIGINTNDELRAEILGRIGGS